MPRGREIEARDRGERRGEYGGEGQRVRGGARREGSMGARGEREEKREWGTEEERASRMCASEVFFQLGVVGGRGNRGRAVGGG